MTATGRDETLPETHRILRELEDLPADARKHRERFGRPLVTVSYAQSLDGSIAVSRGSPLPLSGPESLVLTHSLRAAHDAVLVGIGTVLADRPRLTVRLVAGENPQPVIVDSRLRFPLEANMLHGKQVRPWIATTERADRKRQEHLERAGVRVLRVPADAEGRVDLRILLQHMATLGMSSLMVEGGAEVITSFLSEHLVDRCVLTVTPVIVGGLRAVGNPMCARGADDADIDRFPRVRDLMCEQLGADLVVWGTLVWEAE